MVSPLSGLARGASSASCWPPRLLARRCRTRQWPRLATHHRRGLSSYEPVSGARDAPKDIAVLGGGLTGLTTAYYLTRFHPTAKITLYEADRLGGWIDTLRANPDDHRAPSVNMERGARTVAPQSTMPRWEDFVLYELIHELDCESEVYSIPRHHPRLSKRYIYYPDHLVLLPSTLSLNPFMLLKLFWQCLTEPVFADALRVAWNMDKNHAENLLFDHTKGRQAPRSLSLSSLQDMSMGDLFAARTGSTTIVDNLASALIHGIWGGDIWKLSAMEGTFQAAFLQYHLRLSPTDGKKVLTKESDYFSGSDIITRTPEIARLVDKYADSGYLGFTHGFSALPNKLAKKLEQNPNVTIKKGTHVTALKYNKNAKQAVIHTSQQEKNRHDKVISSLYSGTLGKLAGDLLPTLKEDSAAVSIQIVNIWYENVRLDEKYPGFGYLIPQSVPAENNPCAALGVIFDSDRDAAAGGLDTRPNRGTNLTVMLGGHYWDFVTPDKWPSKDLVVDMAKETVHRHLGIPAHEATYVSTKLCRHCIPQHLVGHRDRMAQAHKEISDAFGETLAVVGGSYTMPGVLPSLQAARDVALAVAGGEYQIDLDIRSDISVGYAMKHVGKTGLGRFVGNNNETFRLVDDRQIPFRSRDHTQFNDPIFQQ